MENKLYNDTLLTEKGYEAANKAANGQGSFVITRTVASENAYKGKTDNELRQLTNLDNEIPGSILDENTINTKKTAINTGFSNELNANGYVANTIGLYAKLDGGDEFLYSVTPSTNGQIVPKQDNNVFTGMKLTIYVLVGNSQKLEVILSPGGDATIDYVNKAVSKCRDELLALINQKENIVDHNEDIKKLRNTINDDIQPKLDKKVTFNGGNITTGNGTFVPAAIGDVVKDNHDGTITYNGNNYSINKTINSYTDYNTITTPGTYLCLLSGKWPNTPLAGTGVNATVILKVENDNAGDVFQTAYAPAIYKPIIRQYSFGKWSSWQQSAVQTDVDTINKTLATKVTFDGGKITTGFGTFVPAAINEVNAINDRLNDKIVGPNQYRDVFNGNVYDLKDKPAGTYWSTGGISGVPNWTGGWGSVNVIHLNPYDTILIANYGGTLTYNSYLNSSWTGWQQFANNSELVNLQNQVNGVLARQSDLLRRIKEKSQVNDLEAAVDQMAGLVFRLPVVNVGQASSSISAIFNPINKTLTLSGYYSFKSWGDFTYIDLAPVMKLMGSSSYSMVSANLKSVYDKDTFKSWMDGVSGSWYHFNFNMATVGEWSFGTGGAANSFTGIVQLS